mmetsp:Transcript_45223/g.104862  ORF Transcript_45223/g.104862 Transcript_45223/m.104862 type:complete len:202 (-) Transcript_45223:601-1206(-)
MTPACTVSFMPESTSEAKPPASSSSMISVAFAVSICVCKSDMELLTLLIAAFALSQGLPPFLCTASSNFVVLTIPSKLPLRLARSMSMAMASRGAGMLCCSSVLIRASSPLVTQPSALVSMWLKCAIASVTSTSKNERLGIAPSTSECVKHPSARLASKSSATAKPRFSKPALVASRLVLPLEFAPLLALLALAAAAAACV